jgi:hypothetical protein
MFNSKTLRRSSSYDAPLSSIATVSACQTLMTKVSDNSSNGSASCCTPCQADLLEQEDPGIDPWVNSRELPPLFRILPTFADIYEYLISYLGTIIMITWTFAYLGDTADLSLIVAGCSRDDPCCCSERTLKSSWRAPRRVTNHIL